MNLRSATLACACALALGAGGARATEEPPPLSADEATACALVDAEAARTGLTPAFLTRLIWTESRFRPRAVSPAGARGIAQFMPATAERRGLENPFDPAQAIPASAAFLADLRDAYGNVGLAAAAYNAGERRVEAFLRRERGLPYETRNYVAMITGVAAEAWRQGDAPDGAHAEDEKCAPMLAALKKSEGAGSGPSLAGTWAPWGAQVTANRSYNSALRTYRRLQRRYPMLRGIEPMVVSRRMGARGSAVLHRVRLPASSRGAAEAICRRLRAAGGQCAVFRT